MDNIEIFISIVIVATLLTYCTIKILNKPYSVDNKLDNTSDVTKFDIEEKKKDKPRESKPERKVILKDGDRRRDHASKYSFKEYSLSSCQSRMYIKRVCDTSNIELVDCWVEGINVNMQGNVVNVSINYKGNHIDIYDVPPNRSREVVGMIGSYFQKNFLWNFRKLEGAFTKVINKHGNTDNEMSHIYLDEIVLLQYKKVVYLFKQYKDLIGVYIQDDRKITVDHIGNYLDYIDGYITQKNV